LLVKNIYPSVLVFVSGAAVLAVELLGTRVLGPFYGVSLFLWSALITVTLLALSVGYAVGGRFADRGPTLARLCYLLLGAGTWLLLLPLFQAPVLRLTEPIGLRFAVLVAAFLLFAPPLTLLGMVSPYAIRLRTSNVDEVGRTAGDLYALSTLGSVLAALLTGFFLIPYVGVSRLTFLVGALLLAVAIVGLLIAKRVKAAGVASVILVPVALFSSGAATERADPEHGLLSVEHSPYAELRVVDVENTRYMLIDGGTHTIVDRLSYESYFPYVNVLDVLNQVVDEPGDLLLVGLGGGSVAKLFARQGWEVDAVEIDPVVTEIARRDFGLEESEARVFHDDGRHYLSSTPKTYDVIVLDAFGSSSIPFHLVTRESFALAAACLKPNGILAINIESVGWDDVLVGALAATLEEEFSEVLALPIAEPPDQLGNVVLCASSHKLQLAREIPGTPDRFSSLYDKNHAWDNRFRPDTEGAQVLTDDLNPVDIWSERINRVARAGLHDYFAEGVSW
jgi:spermidine synthase